MNRLKKIQSRYLIFHFLWWVAVWFFFAYFFSYNSTDTTYIAWFSSLLLPLTMAVTYFFVFFLIPKYLLTKKYLLFGLYTFYVLVFTSYIIVLMLYGCLYFILKFDISNMPPMAKNFVFVLILVFLVVALVSFIYILNHNFRTASENKELQNKILAAQLQLKEQELYYLKKQIHPHFLFNTLNTIYGFALKQSKQTPGIILKLSNLLDYILYQVNKPEVSLREEVMHIKEYIELEKIRFQDTLKIIFTSDEINEDIKVAPMLLIPFVENAFKHGNITDGFLKIEIKAKLKDLRLDFSIRNTIVEQEPLTLHHGIGLDNIRKRLDMLYSKNYRMETKIKNNWYSVNLTIFDVNKIQNG